MIQRIAHHRKILIRATAALAAMATLALAPFLLEAAAPAGTDWQRLSEISQTYGSLLSAAALLFVAASLVHQARQTAIASQEAQHASHRQLLTMTINDPDLMACWEPPPIEVTRLEFKQAAFFNLIFHNAYADYRLMRCNDAELRVRMGTFFQGEVARRHWRGWGPSWRQSMEATRDSRNLRFIALIDEIYTQAVAAGPPRPSSTYFTGSA